MRSIRIFANLVLLLALGAAPGLARRPQATFDRSLVPSQEPTRASPDSLCDVLGSFTYIDDADPFGIAYDGASDTIWVASQGSTSGNTLKSWANPLGGAPLTECVLPTTGAGNGVAVTSAGTLLVTDFQGDLTAFDDHVMEVDANCNLIRFWAIDDASCGGGCPVNPSPDRIDAVLGIDFVRNTSNGYEVVIVDFVNTFTHRVNLVTNDPGEGLSSDWSELGTGDIDPLLGVGVDNAAIGERLSHIAGIDIFDGLQKNACYLGDIENSALETCVSPSDPALTLITGITELPGGTVLQGDLDGVSGTVYTLMGCGDCFVDLSGPVLGRCPGPKVQTLVSGTNLAGGLARLSILVTDPPVGVTLARFNVPPGTYNLAPYFELEDNQPIPCPSDIELTATLTCSGSVDNDVTSVELIPPTSIAPLSR